MKTRFAAKPIATNNSLVRQPQTEKEREMECLQHVNLTDC